MSAPCLAAVQTLLMVDRISTDHATAPSCLWGCLLMCAWLICGVAGVLKGSKAVEKSKVSVSVPGESMSTEMGAAGHGLRLECHLDVTRYMKSLIINLIIWLISFEYSHFTFVEIMCVIFRAVHFELLCFSNLVCCHFFIPILASSLPSTTPPLKPQSLISLSICCFA